MDIGQIIKIAFQKTLCALLVLSIAFIPALNESSIAYALDEVDFSNSKNLVVVLVEKNLINDPVNYPGLTANYPISAQKMSTRVKRYADDISKKLDNTQTTIIEVDSSTSPVEISAL